jgi:hypothetical protein
MRDCPEKYLSGLKSQLIHTSPNKGRRNQQAGYTFNHLCVKFEAEESIGNFAVGRRPAVSIDNGVGAWLNLIKSRGSALNIELRTRNVELQNGAYSSKFDIPHSTLDIP